MTKDYLQVSGIYKTHDSFQTLKGIDLSVQKSEIVCLLGPSGCGKTTLLRIIAGLESQDKGTVILNEQDLSLLAPHKRNFSLMFQEFALFPHKNVRENIVFGLKMKKDLPDFIEKRANQIIELVGLKGLEKRDINDLSGGERQRVALARSLAPKPVLLMLDEPMGSLDRALRERLASDLRRILKKIKTTTLFVTHDQNEAFTLADKIAVLNRGCIEQVGTPQELYNKPINSFVANFLGFQNVFSITNIKNDSITTEIGDFRVPPGITKASVDSLLMIKSEGVQIVSDSSNSSFDRVVKGIVTERRFQGNQYQMSIKVNEHKELCFYTPSDSSNVPELGETISVEINPSALTFIQKSER